MTGVISNLRYYSFIKDEAAFKYALEKTQDDTPGREGTIKVGNNTINTQAVYEISQSMDAWQLASVLLNDGKFSDCSHVTIALKPEGSSRLRNITRELTTPESALLLMVESLRRDRKVGIRQLVVKRW